MSSEVPIPEAAIEASIAPLRRNPAVSGSYADLRKVATDVLGAAAPLVVAAELDALAKKLNERADAVHNPADPTSGLFSGGVMTAASIVSARASVLRGEGQADAE